MTPTSICRQVAEKKCDYVIRCRTEPNQNQNRVNDQVAASERDACIAFEANDPGCIVFSEGWKNGRATLDQAQYFQCVDAAYPASTCVRDLNVVIRCASLPFIMPTTNPGGLCTNDLECRNGFCSITDGGTCGVCEPYLNSDGGTAPCNRDRQCDPARSYCPGADGTTSASGCAPYKGIDAGCGFIAIELAQQEECGPGNMCVGPVGPGTQRFCRPGKAEGDSCVMNRNECLRRGVSGTVCAPTSTGNRCVKIANTTPGGACNTGDFNLIAGWPFCLETEWCNTGTNTCQSRTPVGGACFLLSDTCVFGARCVAVGGGQGNRCVPYSDSDGGCDNDDQCKNLLRCSAGSCHPAFSTIGEPCGVGLSCAEGYCEVDGGCVPLKADGTACSRDNQCQSYVCSTTCQDACWDVP